MSPCSGSVHTKSVGAGRSPAHSWHASLKASSIQASGRFPAYASMAASFQCALLRPGERSKRRNGSPRAARAGAAGAPLPAPPSRSPRPGRSPLPGRAGVRPRWPKGSAVCLRSSGRCPPPGDHLGRNSAPRACPRRPWDAEQRDDPVDVDHQQGLSRGSHHLDSKTVFSSRTGWQGNLPVSAGGSKAGEDPADGPFSGSRGVTRTRHTPPRTHPSSHPPHPPDDAYPSAPCQFLC